MRNQNERVLGGEDEAKKVFKHFDGDGSGKIELAEFAALFDALGAGMTREELLAGLSAVDLDGDGRIDWPEFLRWWRDR